ncbi:MAG: hypothetical protein GX675_03565 [Erysipelotrichaceae bacterium]|nr:hypothetical protein [Erysipelotrichaceae bacterium]
MNDLIITLTIIVITGIVVTFILFNYVKNRKIKKEELEKFCLDNGYTFNMIKDSSKSVITISKDNIFLESVMSLHLDEESDYEMFTRWISYESDDDRPVFVIGSIPIDSDWNNLPESLKNIAIKKIKDETGQNLNPESAKIIETDSKSTFLLFDETSNLSQKIIHKLKPQLSRWSNKHTIFIESNKDEIKLNIYNYFIENVDSLKKIFDLVDNL